MSCLLKTLIKTLWLITYTYNRGQNHFPHKSMLSVGGFVDRRFRGMNNIAWWGKGEGVLKLEFCSKI